jgi:transcriptional regulator with XRE-family HTH domain
VRRSTRASADETQRVVREMGALVRRARTKAGITQEDAAHAAGIDYKRWQRLEAGEVNPTIKTLARVADAIGTDFWSLLGRSTNPR